MSHRVVGRDGSHVQLRLGSGNGDSYGYHIFPAIAFRQAEWANCLPQHVDVVYTINVNEWKGQRSLQLIVQDIRPTEV